MWPRRSSQRARIIPWIYSQSLILNIFKRGLYPVFTAIKLWKFETLSFLLLPFYPYKFLVSKYTREFWTILVTKYTLFSQRFWNVNKAYVFFIPDHFTERIYRHFLWGSQWLKGESLFGEINAELALHKPYHLLLPSASFRREVALKLKMRLEGRRNSKGYPKIHILE